MLIEFIRTHREDLIARTRAKVATRLAPRATARELMTGVPLFLQQLADALERTPSTAESTGAIERSAALHGAALLARGYTVAQVVHDYGDLCQAITELAAEIDAPITTDEFHTLNLSLDNAIAEAVAAYTMIRERKQTENETERSGMFAHELRNRVSAVQLAFLTIKSGRAPLGGSVAAMVTRNLHAITTLIDRALVDVRLDSGNTRRQRTHLFELVEEAEVAGTMAAVVHGVSLTVDSTDHAVDIDVDAQIFAGVLANLLQNAFKFTKAGGNVTLRTSVVGDRVKIDVEDECGGLPAGKADELFLAFQQRGTNRSGLGLGLFISRKGVEANGGALRVRDIPGTGCVFTIDLPRMI